MTRDEFLEVLRRLLPGSPEVQDTILAVADDAGDYQAVAQAVASGLDVADRIADAAERQRRAHTGSGGRA